VSATTQAVSFTTHQHVNRHPSRRRRRPNHPQRCQRAHAPCLVWGHVRCVYSERAVTQCRSTGCRVCRVNVHVQYNASFMFTSTFSLSVSFVAVPPRTETYLRPRLDERWGDALGASFRCLRCLGRCLRRHSSHSSSVASLLLLGWLGWFLSPCSPGRGRPRRRRPRLRLRGGHDKAEDGGAAGCWRRPTTTHKEQMGGLIGHRCAAHTIMASIHSL
jgi:hypothetical protein